jgi:quinol monooxygenase YgiN
MPMLTVVAKLVAKPESIETVKSELLKLVHPSLDEEGCIEYVLHQDNANPSVFIFYENWESMDCLAKHKETVHYKNCFGKIGEMIQDRQVHLMTMVEP